VLFLPQGEGIDMKRFENGRRAAIAKYVAIAAVVGLAATITGASAAAPGLRPHVYEYGTDVNANDSNGETLLCPAKRPNALGGGYSFSYSEPLSVHESAPVIGRYGRSIGWKVGFVNPTDEELHPDVYVVCGP